MNTKLKKGIFWGVIIASAVMVINVLHFLLGGSGDFARGPVGQGPGEMGHRGGFEGHHMMYGHHHEGGFPWLFLIIGRLEGTIQDCSVMKAYLNKRLSNVEKRESK